MSPSAWAWGRRQALHGNFANRCTPGQPLEVGIAGQQLGAHLPGRRAGDGVGGGEPVLTVQVGRQLGNRRGVVPNGTPTHCSV